MELPRYDATNRSEVINFRFRPRAASRLLAVIEITFLLMAIAVAQDAVPTSPADPQIATALQKISSARAFECGCAGIADFRPAPPGKVRLLTAKLENDSTLTWDQSPGGRVSSYEVMWRATASPEWEHVQSVGNATRAMLPMSKDNVIFCCARGGLSRPSQPASDPVPER
jgi:hypothetical protein